jgi:NAD(P)-dependent dehydrogenase (short-subunit alcohol dehydrogenase family)
VGFARSAATFHRSKHRAAFGRLSRYTGNVTDFQLVGKVAVITGGASGIGSQIAHTFAGCGATVAIADADVAGARATAAAIGPTAFAVHCDVTDAASVSAAVDQVLARCARIDVLVSSAGIVALAAAERLSLPDWQRTIAVNLTGTFLVAQAVGVHMIKARSGRIITMASQAAHVALDQHVAYCASKAGVLGLTRVLASEWGPYGITVNSISPTVVLTPLGRSAWSGPRGDALLEQIPTGRFAEPHEVASAARYLASDEAAMVNGADLVIDGGYTIR